MFLYSSCFGSPDPPRDLHAARLTLTYGVARRGQRRDGSVGGRVELLLDFGADNPGKVNNRHGSINTASRAWGFHAAGPPCPGTLEKAGAFASTYTRACSSAPSFAGLYPGIRAPVTNSQSQGFRGNLSSPV